MNDRLRLSAYLANLLVRQLLQRKLSWANCAFLLKRQRAVTEVFRWAKHAHIGNKTFVDPFAPYFPSPYFAKIFQNFSYHQLPLMPNYAQISITNYCPCHCFHCHVENKQQGDIPKEVILEVISRLVANNFPLLFFVGGEPFSRFADLLEFVRAASPYMDTRLFTSGVGANLNRLQELKDAGLQGIYVSLDHHTAEIHNSKRQNPRAFDDACRTITEAAHLDFYVSVVSCVTGAMVRDSSFTNIVDLAENLEAHSIQLNEIRPVGAGRKTADESNVYLSLTDKERLIAYYKAQNRSRRPISIAMPWYLEEPFNLGCTATSGQKVYIDAQGHVQPCELLKLSFGNITERPFDDIWQEMRAQCHHPVCNCIVWNCNEKIPLDEQLPLPPEATRKLWRCVTELPPASLYGKLFPELKTNEQYSRLYFAAKYDLGLMPHKDFQIKEQHWLPRLAKAKYIALGKSLLARDSCSKAPDHEFLHIAQFNRFGWVRVLVHYVFHLCRNLLITRDLSRAFRDIPFEKEARAYEKLRLEANSA